MRRIIDCLCHPSRIGLYYKNKIGVIIAHVVVAMLVFVSVFSVSYINYDYFDHSFSRGITSLIRSSENDLNIKYNDGRLTGTGFSVAAGEYEIYFLDSSFIKESEVLKVYFQEEKAEVYFGFRCIATYEYKNSTAKDFSFAEVKDYNIYDTIQFEGIVTGVFDTINTRYVVLDALEVLIGILTTYFIVLGIITLYSLFINPMISFKVRIKLCLYCSIVYFLAMFFTVCFMASWIQYLAFILPFMYTKRAFRRIVKVKKKA